MRFDMTEISCGPRCDGDRRAGGSRKEAPRPGAVRRVDGRRPKLELRPESCGVPPGPMRTRPPSFFGARRRRLGRPLTPRRSPSPAAYAAPRPPDPGGLGQRTRSAPRPTSSRRLRQLAIGYCSGRARAISDGSGVIGTAVVRRAGPAQRLRERGLPVLDRISVGATLRSRPSRRAGTDYRAARCPARSAAATVVTNGPSLSDLRLDLRGVVARSTIARRLRRAGQRFAPSGNGSTTNFGSEGQRTRSSW